MLGVSCSGGDKPLSPEQRVASVEIAPSAPQLVIPSATSVRLTARATDRAGVVVEGVAISWRSSNPAVVSVVAGAGYAMADAVAPGVATVTATVGGVTGTVDVQVSLAPVARIDVSLAAVIGINETTVASARAYDASGNLLGGRTVQWTSANPAIASVAPNGTVTGISAGETTIAATVEGITSSATLRIVSSPPNLVLQNVYLTQAVQRYGGGVPLVAGGNPVLVNVFGILDRPFASGPVPRVRISVFHGATQFLVDDRQMTGTARQFSDPISPIHQVVLPATIVQPGLRILVTINGDGTPPEATLSDNIWPSSGQPQDVSVRVVPPLPVHFVPILLSNGGSTGAVSASTLPEYLTATRQIHPVAEIEASIGATFTSDVAFGDGQSSAWSSILQQLDLLRVAEGSDRYYVGALRPPPGVTFVQFGGIAYIPFDPRGSGPATRTAVIVGVGWFNRARQSTELVAHELGHTMGRRHAPCGGAAGTDPSYPYAGATIGAYGHDLYSFSLNPSAPPVAFAPGAASDVMSYCTPVWISDYTYEGILNARTTAAATATADPADRLCECLIVWGAMEGDSVSLKPPFVVRTRAALPARRGSASVIGEARDGRQLFHYEFEPAELDHAPDIRHFTFAIPLDEGDRRALVRIRARFRGRAAEVRPRSVLDGASADVAVIRSAVRASRSGAEALELRWDTVAAPVVIVRDPATTRILSIATSGRVVVKTPLSELDVALSDGTTSTVARVRAARR